jgi:hypothetical protein
MSRASLREVAQDTLGACAAGVAEGAEQSLHQGRDSRLLRALPLSGQTVEPDPRTGGGKTDGVNQR